MLNLYLVNLKNNRFLLHTWPVLPCDHTGKQDSVEQAHCTLGAVKRYWDTQCVGGRHNFFVELYKLHKTN